MGVVTCGRHRRVHATDMQVVTCGRHRRVYATDMQAVTCGRHSSTRVRAYSLKSRMCPDIPKLCCEVVIIKGVNGYSIPISGNFSPAAGIYHDFVKLGGNSPMFSVIFVCAKTHTQLTTVTMSPKVPESAQCTHRYNDYMSRPASLPPKLSQNHVDLA